MGKTNSNAARPNTAKRNAAKPGAASSGAAKQGRAHKIIGAINGIGSLAPIVFVVCVVLLLAIGLIMVYSASSITALNQNGDAAYYFVKQLMFVGAGVVVFLAMALPSYRMWNKQLSWIAWAVVVGLLLLTLALGTVGLGAKRWIDIGVMNFQPGELAKIVIILVMAQLVVQFRGFTRRWNIAALVAVGMPVALILMQPDLGTTAIALLGTLVVLWFGDMPKGLVVGIIVGALVIGAAAIAFESFRTDRLFSFLNPWADPQGSGYQVINSFYAFGDGGLFGQGLGMSYQKFDYLPEAQNDFIFAIIGEEFGLVGCIVVMLLFVALVFAALRIAHDASDMQGRIIAGTSGVLIGFQAVLNMLCVMGWLPVTGKPLPFISAGGTSMLTTMALSGLTMSVALHSREAATVKEARRRRDNLVIIEGGAGSVTSRPTRNEGKRNAPSGAPRRSRRRVPEAMPYATSRAYRPPQPALSLSALSAPRSNIGNSTRYGRQAAPGAHYKDMSNVVPFNRRGPYARTTRPRKSA